MKMDLRSVPWSVVIPLCIQAAGAVWWASSIDSRQSNVEDRMAAIEARQQQSDRDVVNMVSQVSELRGILLATRDDLSRLTRLLERRTQ